MQRLRPHGPERISAGNSGSTRAIASPSSGPATMRSPAPRGDSWRSVPTSSRCAAPFRRSQNGVPHPSARTRRHSTWRSSSRSATCAPWWKTCLNAGRPGCRSAVPRVIPRTTPNRSADGARPGRGGVGRGSPLRRKPIGPAAMPVFGRPAPAPGSARVAGLPREYDTHAPVHGPVPASTARQEAVSAPDPARTFWGPRGNLIAASQTGTLAAAPGSGRNSNGSAPPGLGLLSRYASAVGRGSRSRVPAPLRAVARHRGAPHPRAARRPPCRKGPSRRPCVAPHRRTAAGRRRGSPR